MTFARTLAVLALATLTSAGAPSRLTIARLQYDGGGFWYANPSSIPNLLAAIAERTTLPVERREARVNLLDDRLWDYPFLHATGHGNIRLSDREVERLREYLTRGGFLHVSDNYGLDSSFRRETESLREGSVFFSETGSPCFMITNRILATAGRMRTCTRIRPSCTKPRCGWG